MAEMSPLAELDDATLFRLIEPDRLQELQQASGEVYEMRVFMKSRTLGEIVVELKHAIDTLTGARSFIEARLLLKYYVVSWVSLSDVLGALINEAFELGYAAQDVSFQVIMRNSRVARSGLPAIFARHRASLVFERYASARNQLLHRGDFEEDDLQRVEHEYLMAVTQRIRGLNPTDQAAAQSAFCDARDATNVGDKAREVLRGKQIELTEHLSATRLFLQEVGRELSVVVSNR